MVARFLGTDRPNSADRFNRAGRLRRSDSFTGFDGLDRPEGLDSSDRGGVGVLFTAATGVFRTARLVRSPCKCFILQARASLKKASCQD